MGWAKVDEAVGLQLFLEQKDPTTPARFFRDAALSIAVHVVLAVILFSLPEVERVAEPPVIVPDLKKSVTLVAPRFYDLTQKDPNKGKATKSVDVRSIASAPRPQVEGRRTPSPPPAPIAAPTPAPTPKPVIEAPPQFDVASGTGSPIPGANAVPQLPPPAEKPKPKMAFESLASASVQAPPSNPAVTLERNSVQELARSAMRSPGSGGVTVGDDLGSLSAPSPMGQTPSPGKMGSNLQLLSDPNGIDFKPYLVQVLSAVRRNWMAVIPESARLGRKGLVVLQLAISRDGKVVKLVIATPSGTAALDRAAVAGISASDPLPALPPAYKGTEIRLQLAFSYNMGR